MKQHFAVLVVVGFLWACTWDQFTREHDEIRRCQHCRLWWPLRNDRVGWCFHWMEERGCSMRCPQFFAKPSCTERFNALELSRLVMAYDAGEAINIPDQGQLL